LTLWLAPAEISRLGLSSPEIRLQSQSAVAPAFPVKLQPDPTLPPRLAAASQGLAARLGLTLGEVVFVK
jgi:hypothetical protein